MEGGKFIGTEAKQYQTLHEEEKYLQKINKSENLPSEMRPVKPSGIKMWNFGVCLGPGNVPCMYLPVL